MHHVFQMGSANLEAPLQVFLFLLFSIMLRVNYIMKKSALLKVSDSLHHIPENLVEFMQILFTSEIGTIKHTIKLLDMALIEMLVCLVHLFIWLFVCLFVSQY